jgi:hypothetical protein
MQIGGRLYERATLEQGEAVLKKGVALRWERRWPVGWGMLCLTDRRLIWVPLKRLVQIMAMPWSWKRRAPLSLSLAEIRLVEAEAFGNPVVLTTGFERHEFYVPRAYPLVGSKSREWKQAIDEACSRCRPAS